MNPDNKELDADEQMNDSDSELSRSDSNCSDSASDSDSGDERAANTDVQMLDPNEYELQFKTLEQAIYENPCNYQLYVDILKLARENMDFTRLQEFRQKMSEMFPLTEKLWLEWLKDEQKLLTTDSERTKLTDLFERALNDYLSVEIYLEYIQFSIGDMGKPNGIENVRGLCEKALKLAGLDVSKGYALWEAYREFECAILSGLQSSCAGSIQTEDQKTRVNDQIQRVVNLFRRQLAVCLDNTADTYAEFEQFDIDCINEDVKTVYKKSLEKYKEVLPFEMALKNLTSSEVKKLEEYKNYLDYELKYLRMKSPSINLGSGGQKQKREQETSTEELEECRMRVKCLFERALADNQNCLDASLWLKYIYFLNEEDMNFGSKETNDFYLKVSQRSIRNCPWSSKLWINYALNLEKSLFLKKAESNGTEMIKTVFNQALNSGLQTSEDYLQVWHSYLDFLRRQLEQNETSENYEVLVEEIRDAFQKAIDQLYEFFKHQGDPTYSLEKYWAFVEAKHFKNMEKSRKIYNDMILAKTNAAKFSQIWIEFFDLEKEFGDNKHQRKLLNRALNEVNMDEKEVIYEIFFKLEKFSGNVQQQANIYFRYEQFKEVSKVIAARKKTKTQAKEAGQQAEVKKESGRAPENGDKIQKIDRSASLKRKKSETAEEERQPKKFPIKDSDGFAIPSLPISQQPLSSLKEKGPVLTQPKVSSTTTVDQVKKFSDHTVFISNLSFELDETKLALVFEKEPGFQEIRLVRNWSGKSKGYGYVDFDSKENATSALKLDRTPIDGRPLFVSKNTDKSQEVGTESKLKYANTLEKTKLFISGLPFSMDREALEKVFETFAKPKDVRIVVYKNGKSKGLAYAEFENEQDASLVLMKTDGMLIGENQIAVAISNPPRRKESGSFGESMTSESSGLNQKARSLGSGSYKTGAVAAKASNETSGTTTAMSFIPRSQVIGGRKKPTLNFK